MIKVSKSRLGKSLKENSPTPPIAGETSDAGNEIIELGQAHPLWATASEAISQGARKSRGTNVRLNRVLIKSAKSKSAI